MKIWLAKKLLGGITEKVMKAREIKRLRDYVEKDNELDIKVQSLENANAILSKEIDFLYSKNEKYGKCVEELEKEIAILKKNAHPPIFSTEDKLDLERRLTKLELKSKLK